MVFTRSQYQHYNYGDDYTTNDDSIRVNVYGEDYLSDSELEAVTDGVKQMLDENSGNKSALSGYDLYSYHTSKYFDLTFSDDGDSMIQTAYDSLDGSGYHDEHAIVIWAYWSHPSDLSTCGPDSDPCPPTFMMGHDVDSVTSYPATNRQPFVHVPSYNMNLYDIMMGFVPVNDDEKDPVTSKPPAGHELGHALVESDGYDENLTPDDINKHPDHYLGHREYDQTYGISYNTIMTMANNPEGAQNGQCSSPDSERELIRCSPCTDTAIEQTIDYFVQNT